MSIKVGDKIIETDEEGYLFNPDDWTEKVAEEMAFQQSQQDNVKLTETHWGINPVFPQLLPRKQGPSNHAQASDDLGQVSWATLS